MVTNEIVLALFGLVGGLALFIFAMQIMGTSLQKLAGDKMRNLLGSLTSVPVMGVIMGAVVTAVVQSSSLTSVMSVGFVNAGLLTLKQAVSVIMGANIGTTITAQIIAFNISTFSLPILAVGFFIFFFSKNDTRKTVGQMIFAVGLLLFGISMMSDSMLPLSETEFFRNLILTLGHNPILGLLIGLVLTACIQSSAASIGLLIALATQGLITIDIALPILLGDNIGTCITSVLASIGTKLNARRVALAHVMFNVFGSLIFLVAMPLYKELVLAISPADDVARQIANAHTMFNVVNTIIMLPLINIFVKIITKMLPGEEAVVQKGAVFLNWRQAEIPQLSIPLATQELKRMGELAASNLQTALRAFKGRDMTLVEEVLETEEVVDGLEREITAYLAKVAQVEMGESLSITHTQLLHAANDIERVGDHANNIARMAQISIDKKLKYSDLAMKELDSIHELSYSAFINALEALHSNNVTLAYKVYDEENQVDKLEKSLRKNHINRINEGKCKPESAVIFIDVLSNYERVADHAKNIASVVTGDE